MSFYRIKQFWWAISCHFKKIDKNFINKYLNEEEKKIFNKLRKSDKHHSIRVSKDALAMLEVSVDKESIDQDKFAKVALLHDIGKSEGSLNTIEKSIMVLLDKSTKGRIRKYNNIKVIDAYYNHAQKGVNILKKYNYSKDFLDVIEKHHTNVPIDNKMLKILKYSDDKN
ncbi:phosphohydrolase [Clostridium polyendosporum]|uniref:Phosphohydrolase n=1 Tax=Clostridium polyendosporum TaxID=69208 RepID=A0A919S2H8_9CLOT|nr:HDIG domain-containing metalloprotein [Clostridium polyendosporum]GIM29393.1 phosphohydrolase [Clostridium polyendosporum]